MTAPCPICAGLDPASATALRVWLDLSQEERAKLTRAMLKPEPRHHASLPDRWDDLKIGALVREFGRAKLGHVTARYYAPPRIEIGYEDGTAKNVVRASDVVVI